MVWKVISLFLFFCSFAHAEPINLVRIGIFTDNPKEVSDSAKRFLQGAGYSKAANREFGALTPQGYYFHTYLPLQEITNLLKSAPGRQVITFEHRDRANRKSNTQLILTVSRELPIYNQDNLRLFQVLQNPGREIQNIESYLKAMSIPVESLRSANPDHVQQLRFEVKPNQLNFILKLALQSGPLDIRQEVPITDESKPIKVRFVIDKGSTKKSGRPPTNGMRLYDFQLSTLNEQPQLSEILKADDSNRFIFEDGRLSPILLSLVKLGPIRLGTENDSQPISEGKLRGRLKVLALFQTITSVTPTASEKPEAPVAQIPKPDRFNVPLKTEAPVVYLDQDSPIKTYNGELTLLGFADVGQNLEPLAGNSQLEPSTEPGEFNWTLKDLKKGTLQERRMKSHSNKDTKEMSYQVYRGYAWNISGGYGGVGNSKNQLSQFAVGNLNYWFEDTFQRFGLGVHSEHLLNKNPDKILSPMVIANLKYRLSRGLQEYDDSLILNISNQNIKTPLTTASFLGVGAEYSASMPWFLDILVNWIPFLDYPKRLDLGFFYYPMIFGGKNSVKLNIQFYIEPKMYFNSRFYIFGRAQQTQFNFDASEKRYSTNMFMGYGGLGLLF